MDSVRIDKWLWAARFFKTRALAATAVTGGKVRLNEQRIKPAKLVRLDDKLSITRGEETMTVTVIGLDDKRGSAQIAQTLYQETPASEAARQQKKANRVPEASIIPIGKPDKKARRQGAQLKRRH